jgi:cytochrome b subunit of formate dehydrogenase
MRLEQVSRPLEGASPHKFQADLPTGEGQPVRDEPWEGTKGRFRGPAWVRGHPTRVTIAMVILRTPSLLKPLLLGLVLALPGLFPSSASGQHTDAQCLECHEGSSNTEKLPASVHGQLGVSCVDCHAGLAHVELPHDEASVAPVQCGTCHDSVAELYAQSLHGQLAQAGARLAPLCQSCHGSHDIVPVASSESRVAKFEIPFVCGSCHKEGTEVTETYDIPQDKILEHYSESIHGEGLFKQGLIVTAVCTDCHTAHSVLPHTDPKSSIHHENVSKTCQKCHARIEQVHRKVIRGELWEKEPHRVPACVDCHAPHVIRKLFYEQGMADDECLRCHADPGLSALRDGETVSMYVDPAQARSSVHRGTACAKCHAGVEPRHDAQRPCVSITSSVDCSTCHAEVTRTYAESTHGQLAERGDSKAPRCRDCHGVHDTRGHKDSKSPTFPTNVPTLCGQCHRMGNSAALRYTGTEHNVVENYVESIHGKGLLQSGLVVTAMCADCHTAHHVLPASDPRSSVHRANIPQTCARCHNGIYEKFRQSIHSPDVYQGDKPLPECADCHTAHTITRADGEGFKLAILSQCGSCHKEVTETYFDTFHGKVSKLGFAATAKCHDCHGAHDILPPSNPSSRLSRQNIVKTCGNCHPSSHRNFAGYLTHATHHDREKYPILFYTFWFMTLLLVGTFLVAGAHTLLWLPRSWQLMRERRRLVQESHGREVRRFSRPTRQLHILVIISFLGLAVTGMTLKFSYLGWAQWLSHMLGGFESAGYIHRVCAVITFTYAALHFASVLRDKRRQGKSWAELLVHPHSILPNRRDLQEARETIKWFIGLGPRPAYGRWTYWEKFDYFAVFWGIVVIGSTGLVLWFPELFTLFLPGWAINVATIIHSDEALLATGFIFTVHFFNTHFRPDKFPMDMVMFTGRIPLEEFKHERPREYEEMVRTGKLEENLVDPLPPYVVRVFRIFGWTALTIGILLILLIIWAEIFGYR